MSKLDRLKHFLRFNLWIVLLDMVAFCLSYLAALYIRMYVNGVWRFGAYYQDYFWSFIPYYIIASVIVFGAFRLYGGMWQYAGLHDLNRIISANLVTVVLHYGISVLVIYTFPDADTIRMPMAYYPIGAVIQLLLTTLLRFISRYYQEKKGASVERTLSMSWWWVPVKPAELYAANWTMIQIVVQELFASSLTKHMSLGR